MKQVKLTKANEAAFIQLVKESKNDLLTVSRAVNIAAEKGLKGTRRLFVKPDNRR